MNVLVVVDMQNDFISGALGSPQAGEIVLRVKEKIEGFDGRVVFTRDTHETDYRNTLEGKKLPVPHCIRGTHGWEICDELKPIAKRIIDKPGFGSLELCERLAGLESVESVELIGLCTDICIISNAMLIKAFLPQAEVTVDASCCAGTTAENHDTALKAMQQCQIGIVEWDGK